MAMIASNESAPRFRVGDWVVFRYSGQSLVGQVVEEPPPPGVTPHRFYRVSLDPSEPYAFEIAAALEAGFSPEGSLRPTELQFKDEELQPAVLPDKADVCSYLKRDLVAILKSNLVPNRPSPQVWITFAAGQTWRLTHTFTPRRGLVGGATVPFSALHADKVLTTKKQEVIDFLASFGLTSADAEDVLHTVGLSPPDT